MREESVGGVGERSPPEKKIGFLPHQNEFFYIKVIWETYCRQKFLLIWGDLFTGVFIKRRSVNRCLKFVCDVCQKGGSGGEAPRENFGLFVAVFRDPNCFFALQIFGENFRPFRHFHFREKIPLSVISHQKLVGKFSPNYGGKHCYHPLI